MNKKIVIVSDLDGTFLNDHSIPAERNIAAVEELKKAGHYFTIATGRYAIKWSAYANAPIILCNGAFMYDPATGKKINEHSFNGAPLYAILREVKEKYPRPRVRYTDNRDVHFLFENEKDDIGDMWYKVVYESSCRDPDEAMKELSQIKTYFTESYGDRFTYNFSSPWLFEVLQPGVSKGASIGYLRDYFAARGEDVIIYAAGDYENDIEMLRCADVPVCPCNALPSVLSEVKNMNGIIVGDNNGGLIADLIEIAAGIIIPHKPENAGFLPGLAAVADHNNASIATRRLSCAAVIAARNGKIAEYGKYGFSDIENKTCLKPNDIFRLASMTKPIIAAAVMQLHDKGLVSLDDPLSRFIPSFAGMKIGKIENGKVVTASDAEKEIKIVDLMTHSSGLGSGEVGNLEWEKVKPRAGETLADAVPRFGSVHLEFEPRTRISYSGLMAFDTLAYIAELISGMNIADYLDKYLFGPLGIYDITYRPNEDQKKRIVKIYAGTENGVVPVDMKGSIFGDLPQSYFSGGGGLLGSIEDYYKFADMLRCRGQRHGVRVLSEEAVRLMSSPHQPFLLPAEEYAEVWGLGMRIINRKGEVLTKGSFGWSGAYGTHFWIDPSLDIVAVYCSNMTTAGGAGALTAREFERDVMNAVIRQDMPS
jgi:HAD superfamily hydrolase (TIGR01484 family)